MSTITKKTVPWSGVGATYTEEEIELVAKVMRETRDTFTQGKYMKQFEVDFNKYNGSQSAFAVSSCTAALELAAIVTKVGPGDEVIIPGHTFCASAIPFARTGATIVWCDIDPETWIVSAATIKSRLTKKTKCVIVPHIYGLAADMPPIMELAKQHGFYIVEDCAQALGAESSGAKVGSWGDFGCFSFHTHKNITTLGEGGILTVKDPELAKFVPGLRHNGLCGFPEPREKYWVPAMGNVDFSLDKIWPYNFCIGEVQCALGAKTLERVDQLVKQRAARANQFKDAVKKYPELVFQKIPSGQTSAWHLLPARFDGGASGATNHDFIGLMFNQYGIKVIVQYYPLYRYPMFQKGGMGKADCPNTDRYFDNMVSFPFHSWMPEEEFQYMIESTIASVETLRKKSAKKS